MSDAKPHPFDAPRCLECGRKLERTATGWSCPCGARFADATAPNGWAIRVCEQEGRG